MSWVFLIIGIVLEVLGTTCFKLSDGFSRLVPSVLMFVFWGLGFAFLAFALKKIDLSIAYAVWSGAGIAVISLVGIYWFGEHASPLKLICIAMIILGIIGLNLAGTSHSSGTGALETGDTGQAAIEGVSNVGSPNEASSTSLQP